MSHTLASISVLAWFLVARPTRADCPSNQFFAPPAGYATGDSPFRVAVADFNSDGVLDLAAADNGGSDIGILLGIGNGAFHDPVTYPVHPGTGDLIAVDLDRDGILDIAANSSAADVITVLVGHGDGTFAPEVTYPAGDAPYGIASADFNGDGIPDLAASDFLANEVSVMFGQSAGGFAAPVGYAAGTHPYDLATGDFNGDGIVDLVATNQDSEDISVLLGNGTDHVGDGTFDSAVSYAADRYPYSVAIADFDDDGIADLAVANGGAGTISILRGQGNGAFRPAMSVLVAAQLRSVITGDFDRNGVTDLAASDYYGSVAILLGLGSPGHGNGTFTSPWYCPAGANPTGIAAGDFNADSAQDLVVANYLTNHVSVLLHGCGAPPPLVGVIDGPASAFALRAVAPNPSRNGAFAVSFTLPDAQPAKLLVFDLAGRRVAAEDVIGLGAGTHTVQFGRRSPLGEGVYLVRLVHAGRAMATKVVVMK